MQDLRICVFIPAFPDRCLSTRTTGLVRGQETFSRKGQTYMSLAFEPLGLVGTT